MPADLLPEDVLGQLQNRQLRPFYLFYGPGEFLLEKVLNTIRENFIPEEARDFNLQIFYGDEAKFNSGEVIAAAQSFPFVTQNRLIIVRRTDDIPTSDKERFIPYLNEPMESTCLIFISSKPDFSKTFYKKIKGLGCAVNFKKPYDNQVVPWIRRMGKELGLQIDTQASTYLQQFVGNRLRDLYSELEKLYLHFGEAKIGLEEVRKLAVHSRNYTIFELMDQVSLKRRAESISVLNRYLAAEGKETALGIIGMLIRQIKLLWQAKSVFERGGRTADLVRELRVQIFVAKRLEQQSKHWSRDDLERAFDLLYKADQLLKSGSGGRLVLENLVLSICA